MPIEFSCSGCQKVLRVPDEAAGKNAKCPQCGAIVAVPTGSVPFPTINTGAPVPPPAPAAPPVVDAGQNPFGAASIPPTSSNPYEAPPALNFGAAGGAYFSSQSAELGPRWEAEPKSFGSYWKTLKQVHTSPTQTFAAMRTDGDMWSPLSYSMAGGVVGSIAILLLFVFLGLVQLVAGGQNGMAPSEAGVMIGAGLCYAVIIPLLMPVGMFISAGITHLILMIYGGANNSYETTLRVISYVHGATMPWILIPYLGSMVAGILNLVYVIQGLSAAHRISGLKATAVVLTPIILCCGLYALGVGILIFAIAAGSAR
jgi:hypothetical protein